MSRIVNISILLLFLIPAGSAYAQESRTWEYTEFQGQISSVSANGDYVIASDTKIVLAEIPYKDSMIKTIIRDIEGNDISLDALEEGRWIGVKGGTLGVETNTIFAGIIFVLPGELTRTQALRYPALGYEFDIPLEVFDYYNIQR